MVSAGENAFADGKRDLVGLESAVGRKEMIAVLVLLADDQRMFAAVEEQLPHVGFDEEPLLFDADDEIEPLRELLRDNGIERPDHAELEDPEPDPCRYGLVYPEFFQRLANIEIA